MDLLWSIESQSVKTARRVLKTYSAGPVQSLHRYLHTKYEHEIKPSSLSIPTENRSGFVNRITNITSAFNHFSVVPVYIFEDVKANVVVAHCEMGGELSNHDEWRSECVVTMWMSEDGLEVVRRSEFVDSVKARELDELLGLKLGDVLPGFAALDAAVDIGAVQTVPVESGHGTAIRSVDAIVEDGNLLT